MKNCKRHTISVDISGALWIHPSSFHDVQVGDELVFFVALPESSEGVVPRPQVSRFDVEQNKMINIDTDLMLEEEEIDAERIEAIELVKTNLMIYYYFIF